MSEIQSDCLSALLGRFTAEELLEFRRVSKAWCRIIDDPTFIKLHLHYHQTNDSGQHLLIRSKSGNDLYSVSLLDSFDFSEKRQKTLSIDFSEKRTNTAWARPVNKTLTQHGLSSLHALPVPSCNGLILTHGDKKITLVLWNPLTGEFRELPSCVPSDPSVISVLASGLGYDSVADDYKVVRIFSTMATSVYSLKSNSWRRIGDFPGRVQVGRHSLGNGLFLNGALHWISNTKGGEQGIIALDLGTENYRVLSLLPSVFNNNLSPYFYVLSGYLFVSGFIYNGSNCLEGWIMNEYGETNSWDKLFSLERSCSTTNDIASFIPIVYFRSKGLVIFNCTRSNEFFWLYVKERIRKIVRMRGVPDDFTCQVFEASLVRLNTNDSGGVGNSVVEGVVGRKSKSTDDSSAAKGTACRKRKRDDSWLRLLLYRTGWREA